MNYTKSATYQHFICIIYTDHQVLPFIEWYVISFVLPLSCDYSGLISRNNIWDYYIYYFFIVRDLSPTFIRQHKTSHSKQENTINSPIQTCPRVGRLEGLTCIQWRAGAESSSSLNKGNRFPRPWHYLPLLVQVELESTGTNSKKRVSDWM